MGSAVGSDRLAEQKVGKDELAFVVTLAAAGFFLAKMILRLPSTLLPYLMIIHDHLCMFVYCWDTLEHP